MAHDDDFLTPLHEIKELAKPALCLRGSDFLHEAVSLWAA